MIKIIYPLFRNLFCWALIFAGLGSPVFAKASSCVLNFDSDPYIKEIVHQIFDDVSSAQIFDNATPNNFRMCILAGTEEIILLAHSQKVSKSTFLLYSLNGRTLPVEKHFFEMLSQDFKTQKISPPKVLRFVSCDIDEVFKTYPAFKEFISDNAIFLDRAPHLGLVSRSLSVLDLFWLEESRQWNMLSKAEAVNFLVPTTNVLFFGVASRALFGGHFKITYSGINLGLGYFWIPMTVKANVFRHLVPGQSINVYQLNPAITIGVFDRATTKSFGSSDDPVILQLEKASKDFRQWANGGLNIGLVETLKITRIF